MTSVGRSDETGDETGDEKPSARRTAELAGRARANAAARAVQAEAWAAQTPHRRTAWDTALALRARDRSAFASVLGSAIALRLFLFSVALVVSVMSALSLVFGRAGVEGLLTGVGLTGGMAEEVARTTGASARRDLGVFSSSIVVALLAGRSLTKVLAACSVGAWAAPSRRGEGLGAHRGARDGPDRDRRHRGASVLTRLRGQYGVAVATSSLAVTAVLLGLGWFFVTLALPRPTRDPGALVPGAAVFAFALTLVQWFMHYYLPFRIEASSQTMGSLSVTVASLGYLFVIGRLMAGTVVLNAVVYEQFGTISTLVFGLPLLERIPRRFPRVAAFFDLPVDEAPPPPRSTPG